MPIRLTDRLRYLETFLAEAQDADPMGWGVPTWLERDFRSYLRCGILAHGFARVRCTDCGHDRLLAPGLLLQGSRRLPVVQCPAHGGGGRAPHRRGDPATPHPAVGAVRAQASAAFPAPDARGGECRARHLPPGAPGRAPRREPGRTGCRSRRAARSHLLPAALREFAQPPLPLPRAGPRRRDLRRRRARGPVP